uniref:Uncharacterized protein n=1 Tax=Setaria italica TaxID=4555 RepID=K3YP49_SETIT
MRFHSSRVKLMIAYLHFTSLCNTHGNQLLCKDSRQHVMKATPRLHNT